MRRLSGISFFITVCLLSGLGACQTVKPYQRAYLNDSEMRLGARSGQKFEWSVHNYREGAMGGRPGKATGGCGCN